MQKTGIFEKIKPAFFIAGLFSAFMLNAPVYAVAVAGGVPCSASTGRCSKVSSMGSTYLVGCMAYHEECFQDSAGEAQHGIYVCTSCASGYSLVSDSLDRPSGCSNSYTYTYCKQNCTGCSNCTSDTTWSSNGTGKEKLTTRTCSCNTCNTSTQYRCAAGYYGNGTTCTACPSGGTSSAGTTTVGGCCATSFSDTKGSGNYNRKCCAS